MYKRLFTSAAILGVMATAPPTYAQSQAYCSVRDAMVQSLEGKYQEHFTAGGLQGNQQLVEVWTSTETGSFTILVTKPSGFSCIVATGTDWFQKPQVAMDNSVAG